MLLQSELGSITDQGEWDEFSVKASLAAREVIARYEKDDTTLASMEYSQFALFTILNSPSLPQIQNTVAVRLPPSYPLRSVEIESAGSTGVTETQWRRWQLSMMTLFLTQAHKLH